LMWRGLETGSRRTYTGTKLETADTAKGSLRSTAPVLDPTLNELNYSCVYLAHLRFVKLTRGFWGAVFVSSRGPKLILFGYDRAEKPFGAA